MFIFAFMKSDRFGKYIKGLSGSIFALFGRRAKTKFSNPRRYRLDFIAENTFNRVWTVRFSQARVIIVSLTFIAAIGALMFVIVFFSPIRKLLPGRLEGDLRSRYIDMSIKLDSIQTQTRINDKYIENLRTVLTGNPDNSNPTDDINDALTKLNPDSILSASEAERRFVQNYEAANRFNLSVLTPIAAESMAFYSPVSGTFTDPMVTDNATAVVFDEPGLLAVSSTYRGTVLGIYNDAPTTKTLIIQHPNDFVSIYRGISDCFAKTGDKVIAGQRIGHSGNGSKFRFELWHNGSATNPTDYISF